MKLKSLYRLQGITYGVLAMSLLLTGCQSIPVIEKSEPNQVIQEEFTQSAVALTNELNDYEPIEELFVENESDNALELQVRKYISENEAVKKNKLKLDTLDLKLFIEDTEHASFLALMSNQDNNPYTMIGVLDKAEGDKYSVVGEHLGAYAVNMPKTFLLKKGESRVVISQRPFSTFEECYFFKLENSTLQLYQRGWEDLSLLYYSSVTEFLEAGQLEEAMAVEDTSMYPMGYEQLLFETANLMIRSSEKKAIELEKNETLDKGIVYLEWSLNYYFENHYGANLDSMVMDGFAPMLDASEGDFGYNYLMDQAELKTVLLHYANLLGKVGRDKDAALCHNAIARAFD